LICDSEDVIEVDGVHVPKRGKEKWNECRVGVIFESPPSKAGRPAKDRRPENVQYVAGIEHIEDFG